MLGLMALRDGFGSLRSIGGGPAGPQNALPMAMQYRAQQAEQEKLQQALERAKGGGALPMGMNQAAFDALSSVDPRAALGALAQVPKPAAPSSEMQLFRERQNNPEFATYLDAQEKPANPPAPVKGADGYLYDPITGQRTLPGVQKPPESPDFGLADKISDNFRSEPSVKIFGDVQDAAARIGEFYNNPGSVSDYGLAVSFAKLVDPGSVAREGEVAAVQKSGALSQSMKQSLLNAITGEGALPPQMREEIATLAQRFYDVQANKYQRTYDDYSARAGRLGVPTDLALPSPLDPFSVMAKEPSAAGGNVWDGNRQELQPGTRLQNPQTGEVVEWNGSEFIPVQ